MKYIDAIKKYYNCFSTIYYNQFFGKNQSRIAISGKLNFRNALIWIAISVFLIFVSTVMNKGYVWICLILGLIAIIAVIIKSKLIYKNLEHKPRNINLYQRELPSNLRPAQVRLLLQDGLVDEKSLAATIVDLIDRGYLDIRRKEEKVNDKMKLFKDREIIISKTNKPTDNLLRYEKFVIKWFIEKYGDGKEVSADIIMEKLHKNIYKEQPCDLFECWQGLVFLSFPLKKFYKITLAGKSSLLYLLLSFLGFTPAIPIIGQALGVYALGCLLFASPSCILNDQGIEEKDKWLDLKRYLEDYSNIGQNTTEIVSIWEFYLTYSIALGIKSISSQEIEAFFGDNIYNKFENIQDEASLQENEIKIIEEVNGDYKQVLYEEIKEEINKLDLK